MITFSIEVSKRVQPYISALLKTQSAKDFDCKFVDSDGGIVCNFTANCEPEELAQVAFITGLRTAFFANEDGEFPNCILKL